MAATSDSDDSLLQSLQPLRRYSFGGDCLRKATKLRADIERLVPLSQPADTVSLPFLNASCPQNPRDLAPQLRNTLDRLLAGDSEKQIAIHLNRSPHTVHAYVKTIYRRFGVCSRAELLSRWVKI